MPQRILSPYSVKGLARQFVVPGPFSPLLGDQVYGVQDAGDFAGKSPFADGRSTGAQTQASAAAGAGVYSSCLIRPGVGTIFVVERILVNTGSSLQVQLRLCRPADVALLTVVLATPFGALDRPMAQSGFIPTLAATLTSTNRNNIATGGLFGAIRFAANAIEEHTPPRGIVLRGDVADNATALLIQNATDNATIAVTVYGTEYPAPPTQIP